MRLGAQWRAASGWQHGNVTAFSFYATKNITTIEGGALATEDQAFAAKSGALVAPRP